MASFLIVKVIRLNHTTPPPSLFSFVELAHVQYFLTSEVLTITVIVLKSCQEILDRWQMLLHSSSVEAWNAVRVVQWEPFVPFTIDWEILACISFRSLNFCWVFFSLVEHTNENLTCQKLTHVIIALLESVYVCNMESKKLFTVWHL